MGPKLKLKKDKAGDKSYKTPADVAQESNEDAEAGKKFKTSEEDANNLSSNAGAKDQRGVSCPVCGCRDLRVIYTDKQDTGTLRRRACRHCGRRITTKEKAL